MAEVINTNVFDAEKKFVDFAGLDYFWEKAKTYVDDSDKVTADKVATLEGVVGNDASGLVQKVNLIQGELDGLNGGAGSITTQITNALAGLDVEDVAVEGQYVSSVAEVDGKVVVTRANLPVYEEVGVAAGLNEAMDARVKVLEGIDHDKLAADAAAAAVADVIDGAPEKFDTLKEIAAWIAEADTAEDAASLVTRVSALEAIDHDAYVAADEKVLEDANAYADGLAGNYDAAGAAATAKSEAIAQAKLDAAEALKAYYTKEEVDGFVDSINGNIESAATTAQTAAEAYAKTYTDALFTSFKFAANSDIDTIFA